MGQSLYELKVLSYPRTNSRYLTEADATKIPAWIQTLQGIPEYAALADQARTCGLKLGKDFVDDEEVEDHSALVPTEERPGDLTSDQRKIYDLVARRFLAAFFPDRIESKTTLITEVEGETFQTKGTVVLDPGWSAVDTPPASKKVRKKKGEESEEEVDDKAPLPPVRTNDRVTCHKAEAPRKQTTAPKRFTEADLLAAMQSAGKDLEDEELRGAMRECGLGTPATRAATIEKLLNAGTPAKPRTPLARREGKAIVPTDKGITLIQLAPESLTSPELTGQWEATLERMRRGEVAYEAFQARIHEYVDSIVADARKACPSGSGQPGGVEVPRVPAVEAGACPTCKKGTFLVRPSQFGGFWAACSTQGCAVKFSCDEKGIPLGGLCGSCGGPVDLTRNQHRRCASCGAWQNEGPAEPGSPRAVPAAGMCPPKPSDLLCPSCGKHTKTVFSSKRGVWLHRCDPCSKWLDANSSHEPQPLGAVRH